MGNRPLAVDLFSGAGGLSLGFEQAGFDVVAAVEIDPIHASVHQFNFPNCAVIPKSIADLSGAEIRQVAGIGTRPVDVVFGGPPCQGFSLIGKRALDDPRNSLVRQFARIVSELSAQYFLFENVRGLTIGKHKQILEELVREFKEIGYDICLPWKVLNAMNYGVPQDRERLFLLGYKQGVTAPQYPSPITFPCHQASTQTLLPIGPSCRDALGDLPDAERFQSLLDDDEVETNAWGKPSSYAQEMRCSDGKGWYYGYQRKWRSRWLTSSIRTNHTALSRQRFAQTPPGKVEPVSRFFKLSGSGISNTLRAGTDSARGAFTSPRPIHYEKDRCITVREMARLHGFPDWFRLHKTKWHGGRQIGNAVPPPLARALAFELLRSLGIQPQKPSAILKLGDVSLLGMDMTGAAKYWQIDIPIAKRDRKRSTRNRKPAEADATEPSSRGGSHAHQAKDNSLAYFS